ncbi:hypothetical protein V493_03378, partial [Pseudogymnoascus sp. VKM F-4281 (FW-2241)]
PPNEHDYTTMAHAQAHPPPALEALSLDERAGAGPGAQGPAPALGQALHPQQAPQQLPPQMFTTAAQLLDLTDKKLMVALRDGRKLIGVLRSWDQFAPLHALAAPAVRGRSARDVPSERRKRVVAGRGGPR